MRRVFIRVLICLFLGAMVNTAIALGIAWQQPEGLWSQTADRSRGYTHTSPPSGFIDRWRSTGHIVITRYEAYWPPAQSLSQLPPPWWSAANERPVIDDPEHPDMTNKAAEAAYGWPLVSLKYEYRFRHMPVGFSGNLYFLDSIDGGVVLSQTENLNHVNDWRRNLHVIPYRVLPLHFAINSALYASIIALLYLAPVHMRRRWRLRHGRCPTCAYPMGDSPVCTECGTALPAVHRRVRTNEQ